MSTLRVGTYANADGTQSTSAENVINGSAKAWVNFNGTGTVAIREDYNVSSITDNGTGDYTVNFTTAMPDANYAVTGAKNNISASAVSEIRTITFTAESFTLQTIQFTSPFLYDESKISLSFFR